MTISRDNENTFESKKHCKSLWNTESTDLKAFAETSDFEWVTDQVKEKAI